MLLPEVKRVILLSEEGLLCRCCHGELRGQAEIDAQRCQRCVQHDKQMRRWFRRQKGGA